MEINFDCAKDKAKLFYPLRSFRFARRRRGKSRKQKQRRNHEGHEEAFMPAKGTKFNCFGVFTFVIFVCFVVKSFVFCTMTEKRKSL